MRILITGASGFLGRHLARDLARRHEVFATIRGAALPEGMTPLAADLAGSLDTSRWPAVDAVAHLAQSPRYAEFPKAAGEVFAIAAGATQALLEYALRCGARRFVFASTGGIYARQPRPLRETDPIEIGSGGIAHYLASKRSGELITAAYRSAIETCSARIFFCYGPGQRLPMLVPRLIERIRAGETVSLPGENGPEMNPVFVDDAVRAIAALVEAGGPPVVNIAGPRVVTLRDMCRAIGLDVGREAIFKTDPSARPPYLVADTSLMAERAFRPSIDPLEGAARAARAHLAAGREGH
jgi:nucleoside-diphosphate-sugar epimerase